MNIIKEGADKVSIKFSPQLFRGIGILFFLTGLALLALLSMKNTLVCQDKSPGLATRCELTHNLVGLYQYTDRIDTLKKATLHRYRNSNGRVQYHIRLAGLPHDVIVNFMPTFRAGSSDNAVKAINHYINESSQTHYLIPFVMNYFLLSMGFILTLLGVVFFRRVKTVLMTCDKTLNQLSVIQKHFFKPHKNTYHLDDIDHLALETKPWVFIKQYRLAFVLKDGRHIPLTKNYDDTPGSKIKLAALLNEFLGLPTDESIKNAAQYRKSLRYFSGRLVLFGLILLLLGYFLSFIATLQL